MQKVERDGKTAVIYSGGYGSGWYSENRDFPQIMFHPFLVRLIEQDRRDEINKEMIQKILHTNKYICVLGAERLEIEWVKKGIKFRIDEYDGLESVVYEDKDTWFTA